MSTRTQEDTMSSTATKTPDTVDAGINWEAIFDSIGNKPWEPVSSSQLALMVSIEADDVDDEQDAGERMLEAVDNGILEKESAGYTIADATPPEPDTNDDTTKEPDNLEEQHETSENNTQTQAKDTHDDVVDMSRPELEAEVRDLRDRMTAVERKVEQFPAMLAAFRNLLGDVPIEDLPDAAAQHHDRLERQDDVVREVSDKLTAIDDLTDGRQETTEGRVVQLRRYLVEQAEQSGGTYGMTYNQIHSYFSGEISESWASQLQTKVAEDHEAFFTKKTSGKTKVCVNLDKVDERSIYRLKNSGESEEA